MGGQAPFVTDCSLAIAQAIDLDAAEGEEVLLLDDAISDKAQKSQRQFGVGGVPADQDVASTGQVFRDVVVLQTAPGQHEFSLN